MSFFFFFVRSVALPLNLYGTAGNESGIQTAVRSRRFVVFVVIVAIVRRLWQIGRLSQHGRRGDSGRRTAGHAAATNVIVGRRTLAPRFHQRWPASGCCVRSGQCGRAHRVAESGHVLAGFRSVAQRAGQLLPHEQGRGRPFWPGPRRRRHLSPVRRAGHLRCRSVGRPEVDGGVAAVTADHHVHHVFPSEETVYLHLLPARVQQVVQPAHTRAHAHRRTALPVRRVRQGVPQTGSLERPQVHKLVKNINNKYLSIPRL